MIHHTPTTTYFTTDLLDRSSARLVVYFSPHPWASAAAVSDSA